MIDGCSGQCNCNRFRRCSVQSTLRMAPLNVCFYILFYVFLLSLFTRITSALFIYDKRTLLDIGHRCTNLLQDTLSTDPAWPVEILRNTEDCKALQRVVRLAERISGSALPSLQDIYLKRCKSRAAKIIKDSNHPSNCLFTLLPSGKRFKSVMAKTERLRRSFFPQAIRLLNSVS